MSACPVPIATAFAYGAWASIAVVAVCLGAAWVGRYTQKRESVDRVGILPSGQVGQLEFRRERLRFRPMSQIAPDTDQFTLPLERRWPELTKRLRAVALQLAREKGEITADDVHQAHPIPAGVDGRIMGVVFKDKGVWRKTGRYIPTSRKSAHGRPVPVWALRENVLA